MKKSFLMVMSIIFVAAMLFACASSDVDGLSKAYDGVGENVDSSDGGGSVDNSDDTPYKEVTALDRVRDEMERRALLRAEAEKEYLEKLEIVKREVKTDVGKTFVNYRSLQDGVVRKLTNKMEEYLMEAVLGTKIELPTEHGKEGDVIKIMPIKLTSGRPIYEIEKFLPANFEKKIKTLDNGNIITLEDEINDIIYSYRSELEKIKVDYTKALTLSYVEEIEGGISVGGVPYSPNDINGALNIEMYNAVASGMTKEQMEEDLAAIERLMPKYDIPTYDETDDAFGISASIKPMKGMYHREVCRWSWGEIKYKFGNISEEHREAVLSAMNDWTNKTGGAVKFSPSLDSYWEDVCRDTLHYWTVNIFDTDFPKNDKGKPEKYGEATVGYSGGYNTLKLERSLKDNDERDTYWKWVKTPGHWEWKKISGYWKIYKEPHNGYYIEKQVWITEAEVWVDGIDEYTKFYFPSLTRTVRHELGHIIGLKHEHQRPDRNDYISIPDGKSGDQYDVIEDIYGHYVASWEWGKIDTWTIWYYDVRWEGPEWWLGGKWVGEWNYYYYDVYGWVPVWLPDRKVAMSTDYDIDSIMQYTGVTLRKDYMGKKKDDVLRTYEISSGDAHMVRTLYYK